MTSHHIPLDSTVLLDTLSRCAEVSIVVVGDLMLDEYVGGTVERISPEAPVPIVRAATSEFRLGGAANVARQLTALGAQTTLIGMVGNDAAGETLRRLCQESGISTHGIVTAAHRSTTRKLRVLSQSQQLLRIDWEDRHSLADEDTDALLERINGAGSSNAVILSDYAKGVLSEPVIAHLMTRRPLDGPPMVIDPKHRDFARYRGASVLTPNLRELSEAVGHPLDPADLAAIADAARSQIPIGDFEALVVTLGDRGILIVSADGEDTLIPALKRAVYDVTGAGDTAAAVLTACLATGASITAAAHIANAAAGIAVGEIGAVSVPSSRIADALIGRIPSKVLSRIELQARSRQWRERGQRIVFTNGCFDLLHPGHLSLLSYAKSLGDILVLAINSDAAVRRLKGPSRPVVSQGDRAAMLSALACVDAVTIFDEDTPLEAVRSVQPQVLVKGQDYQLNEVIGREFVEAAGGRVVLAPLLASYSTTSLLARARA
jgi:D-beta-D-heptose 7-phosphate kinase / D-beta-D-heptose 1-phosphate adenosyltransferase